MYVTRNLISTEVDIHISKRQIKLMDIAQKVN
jgi:hypothetical protein